jgi:hypothetical protein
MRRGSSIVENGDPRLNDHVADRLVRVDPFATGVYAYVLTTRNTSTISHVSVFLSMDLVSAPAPGGDFVGAAFKKPKAGAPISARNPDAHRSEKSPGQEHRDHHCVRPLLTAS